MIIDNLAPPKQNKVPRIDEVTGNWFIGDVDTGIKAVGKDGITPIKGVDYFTEEDKDALVAVVHENNQSMYDKVDRIAEYQKYVNTELDSCHCQLVESYTAVLDACVPFVKISGNMNVENGLITVKPGSRIQVTLNIGYHNANSTSAANVRYRVKDITNDIIFGTLHTVETVVTEYCKCSSWQYTNNTSSDILIGVYIDLCHSPDTLNATVTTLTVQEIGRQIVIDPLEYVNTTQGIEDAPVGHIISHMGTVAPKHYLICDGAEYNIADYPYLAQHMIDNFGSVNYFGGDGETTFAVPDLRGEFLRGTGTATRDTGSGGEVGEHQDPTQIPFILLASSDLYLYYGDYSQLSETEQNNKWLLPTDVDKYIGSGQIYQTKNSGQWSSVQNANAKITARPTNTSVLYCIKYEPTYYMQVHQTNYMQQNIYSEEEQVVGKWIDGKPIYRKTIVNSMPTITTNNDMTIKGIDISVLNVSHVVNLYGSMVNASDSANIIPINWNIFSLGVAAWVGENTLAIASNNPAYSNSVVYVTLEYTKAADAENSFTNDMIQDYVTTEPYSDAQVTNAIDELWQ